MKGSPHQKDTIPLKSVFSKNAKEVERSEIESLIKDDTGDKDSDGRDGIRKSPQFFDVDTSVTNPVPGESNDRFSTTKVSCMPSQSQSTSNSSEVINNRKPDLHTTPNSIPKAKGTCSISTCNMNLNSGSNSEFLSSSWSEEWNVELNHVIVMKAQMLLLRLAKAFFVFGAPLYRIEARVQSVASHIGVPLSISAFPTSISLFFGDGTTFFWPQTFLVKGMQRLNMAKLQAIDRWAIKLAGGQHQAVDSKMRERLLQSISQFHEAKREKKMHTSPVQPPTHRYSHVSSHHFPTFAVPPHHTPRIEKPLRHRVGTPKPTLAISERELDIYLEELDKVVSAKDVFHSNYRIVGTAIIGSLLYTLWHPVGWKDFLLSFGLSLMNGVMCKLGDRYQLIILEVLIPMILSFIAKLFVVFLVPDICIDKVIILSCFNFFPGIAITLAMVEFSSGNLEAGTVRMFYSFIRCLKLGFGVSIGSRLVHWLFRRSLELNLTCPPRSDTILFTDYPGLLFLLFFPLTFSINIFLLGHYKQFPIMSLVSLLGFTTLWASNLIFEKDTSIAFSSFVIGLVSHVYARIRNDIAIASILSGIFLLVPGSLGVSGAALLFMDKDLSGSTEFATQTLSNAMSISIGLVLSSLIAFPFKKKNKFMGLSLF